MTFKLQFGKFLAGMAFAYPIATWMLAGGALVLIWGINGWISGLTVSMAYFILWAAHREKQKQEANQ